MKNNVIRLVIGGALAGLFIWLIFRRIGRDELISAFSGADYRFATAAVLAFFAGYSCRIERWRLMLVSENSNLLWKQCAGPLMASVAANNILPLRAGDLLRAFGFNRTLRISTATSLTTLLVERLLDLLMLVLLLGLTLAAFGLESSKLVGLGGASLIGLAALILFLLLFPSTLKPIALLLGRSLVSVHPALGGRALDEIGKIFSALEHTSSAHIMIRLIFFSLLAWIAEGLVFWFGALSLPAVLHPMAAWLALPVGTLATLLPGAPGYVGTFDYFVARAMSSLGDSPASATAYAFTVHAILWLPPSLAGGVYLLLSQARRPQIESKAVELERTESSLR